MDDDAVFTYYACISSVIYVDMGPSIGALVVDVVSFIEQSGAALEYRVKNSMTGYITLLLIFQSANTWRNGALKRLYGTMKSSLRAQIEVVESKNTAHISGVHECDSILTVHSVTNVYSAPSATLNSQLSSSSTPRLAVPTNATPAPTDEQYPQCFLRPADRGVRASA